MLTHSFAHCHNALICTIQVTHGLTQCLHAHSHARTCSHTFTCTQMHYTALTHMLTYSNYVHTYPLPLPPAHSHTYTYCHTCSLMRSCTNSSSHTHMHTLTRTHSHTPFCCTSPTPTHLAACPSKTTQAWPHPMAVPCSLFPLGYIYFS